MSAGAARRGSRTLHRARWVLPIAGPPIEDGAVLLEDCTGDSAGLVLAVGSSRDVRAADAGAVSDHGEAVILPGLVNAHTHLELAPLAGRLPPGLEFTDWIAAVVREVSALAAAADPGMEGKAAIDSAIGECVATGTALAGEVTGTGAALAALGRSPLRARVYHEVIAFDPRQAEQIFAAARDRLLAFEAGGEESAASGPGSARPGSARSGSGEPGSGRGRRLRHSLAPHAPYSVSSRLLRLVRGFNQQEGRPTSIHLAESAAESEFLRTGGGPIAGLKQRLGVGVNGWEPPGQSSAVVLSRLGWFDAPGLVVHGTQLGARDLAILSRAPITVCLCPRSNRTLGVGVAPAAALAAAGVPLALGTDSLASAPSLDLFDELAVAATDYGLEPDRLIEAATRGGARALGFGEEMGELVAGRRAAVIAVAAPQGTRIPDPYALLLGRPSRESIRWLSR